jgi:hypothetical protein
MEKLNELLKKKEEIIIEDFRNRIINSPIAQTIVKKEYNLVSDLVQEFPLIEFMKIKDNNEGKKEFIELYNTLHNGVLPRYGVLKGHHGIGHIENVLNNALFLMNAYFNFHDCQLRPFYKEMTTLICSVFYHDIGRLIFGREAEHEKVGVEIWEKEYERYNVSFECKNEVSHCIRNHRASTDKEVINNPHLPLIEACKILRDADHFTTLDDIIIRSFEYRLEYRKLPLTGINKEWMIKDVRDHLLNKYQSNYGYTKYHYGLIDKMMREEMDLLVQEGGARLWNYLEIKCNEWIKGKELNNEC